MPNKKIKKIHLKAGGGKEVIKMTKIIMSSLSERELRDFVDREAVSTRMKNIGNNVISDIVNKGTHLSGFKTIQCGTLDDFKKNLDYKIQVLGYKPTVRELWVYDIDRVMPYHTMDYSNEGILLHHKKENYILPFYDVLEYFKIEYHNGRVKTTVLNWDNESKHYSRRINGDQRQSSIYYEALVKIADDVLHNRVPFDLRGLHCNIINCTGNNEKAKEFGLEQSFNPRLLEWVFEEDHGTHEKMCTKAFQLTGKAWEISAKDYFLRELMKSGTPEEIKQYLEWFCFPA